MTGKETAIQRETELKQHDTFAKGLGKSIIPGKLIEDAKPTVKNDILCKNGKLKEILRSENEKT